LVVRYVVVDSSVEPAPLPRSDAPANDDSDPGDPADDEGAEDDPRAAFDEDPEEEACRSCVELRQAHGRIEHQLWEAESRAAVLQEKVEDWERRHKEQDRAHLREESDLRGRCEGLQEQLAVVKRERDEALREAQSLAAQARPTLDPGAVGQYLLTLARQHLAEARALAARAQELEAAALAAVEEHLDAPAGGTLPVEAAPTPAPSPVEEEPPPSGDVPRLPPSGTLQYDVLQLLLKRGRGDAQTLATRLRETKARVSSALSLLTRRGLLVRVATGLYEVAPTVRRAA
jgi:hypothetical protein